MNPPVVLCAAGLILSALPAMADVLVATRTIRAMDLIGPGDVALASGSAPGGLTDPSAAIGMEARVALYPGRPVREIDIGPPAVVERNAIVTLAFSRGGIMIATEGRALARAGVGDTVRVMNLASRATIAGVILEDGTVRVSPGGTLAD